VNVNLLRIVTFESAIRSVTFIGGIYFPKEVHPIHHYPVDKEQGSWVAAVCAGPVVRGTRWI